MTSRDDKKREKLFLSLCKSEFPSIHDFLLSAVFNPIDLYGVNYDEVRQSRLTLLYMKNVRLTDTDRESITGGMGSWLCSGWAAKVPEDFLRVMEDWLLTELAAVDHPSRCKYALQTVRSVIMFSTLNTPKVFTAWGRCVLEDRLRACARAQNPENRDAAQEILQALDKKKHGAAK